MGMEGETSSKPSNPSEDTSTSWRVERSGGGGIGKRKVGEQAGRVAKVARCMEGSQGSTGGPPPEMC